MYIYIFGSAMAVMTAAVHIRIHIRIISDRSLSRESHGDDLIRIEYLPMAGMRGAALTHM